MIPINTSNKDDELFGVDLSHLSSEEKAVILQVAARAKLLESNGHSLVEDKYHNFK